MKLKQFGKNTIIYGIGNIGLRASAFLLIPIYTHALSIKDYGILVTLLLTAQIMIILMNVGMRNTLIRFANECEKKDRISYLLGTSILLNVVGGIIVTTAMFLFFKPFFRNVLHTGNVSEFLILTTLVALFQSLSLHIMSYYRARNLAIKFTLVGISAAVLLIAATSVLLLLFKLGIRGALIANIFPYFVILIFLCVDVLFNETGIGFSFKMASKIIRFGFPLIFSMLGQLIMGASSIYFLGYFEGIEDVAIYSLGYKLASVLGMLLILPFQLAFQPFVFGNLDTHNLKENIARIFTYFLLSISFFSLIILLISRILLPFIAPPEYSAAYLVIILLLPSFAFNGLVVFGETLLSVKNKTHIIGTCVAICAGISLILNHLLIPLLGWYGAIIASNISSIIAGLVIFIIGLKSFPIPIEWFRTTSGAIIFTYFIFLVILLHTKSDLIFYAGAIISICLYVTFLKFGSFFNDPEKKAIKNSVQSIWLRLSP